MMKKNGLFILLFLSVSVASGNDFTCKSAAQGTEANETPHETPFTSNLETLEQKISIGPYPNQLLEKLKSMPRQTAFLADGEINPESPEFITVFRGINVPSLDHIDLDYNYNGRGQRQYDFVQPYMGYPMSWAARGLGLPILLVYRIPAFLVLRHNEPGYYIPPEKLQEVGLASPSIFLISAATFKKEDYRNTNNISWKDKLEGTPAFKINQLLKSIVSTPEQFLDVVSELNFVELLPSSFVEEIKNSKP